MQLQHADITPAQAAVLQRQLTLHRCCQVPLLWNTQIDLEEPR